MKATEKIPPINDKADEEIHFFLKQQAIVIASSRPPDFVKLVAVKSQTRKTKTSKIKKISNTDLDVL